MMTLAGRPEGSRGRILLVEDEWAIAKAASRVLVARGFTVIGPAATTVEALALIEKEAISLAVLDIQLSDRDAYPVAEELRRRDIPILFVTGYAASEVRADFSNYPMFCKPYGAKDLLERLETIFNL